MLLLSQQMTAIGKIGADWDVVDLGQVSEPPQYGLTASAAEAGNIQFLRITDINGRNVNWAAVPYCDCPEVDVNRYLLRAGDILFARIGATTGKSTLIVDPPKAVFASYLIRVRTKPNLDPEFLSHFFQSRAYWRQVDGNKLANLKKGVSGSILRALLVPKPPLAEQRQIARVLSAVQRAIERQERLIALTAELKKALMHHLFTHGARGEPIKETEIGPVPESWTVGRLDTFCILQRGFDITKVEQTDGVVPVVSSGGVKSYHNVARVKGPGVIVGRKGTLGTVHYVEGPYWPHDTTLWVKDFRGNDPRFSSYFLDTLNFARFDSGASNPTLNRNTVHGETVAYPPPEQQVEIAGSLAAVEVKHEIHERIARSLQLLFRTLLHQLMTAQIRVSDLDLSAIAAVAAESKADAVEVA